MVTPEIDISGLTNPQLSFDWYSNNINYPGDNNPLIIEVFDGTSWNDLDTLAGDSPAWLSAYFDLTPYIGNIIQIRFRSNQTLTTNSSYYNDLLLDDVSVDEEVTCEEPINLSASNATQTSIDLTWTDNNGATSWEVEYGPVGFTIGSGTSAPPVTSNPYTLSAIPSSTTFEYYVRAVCGPGDESGWAGPIEFTTLCDVFTAPFSEGFDTGELPNCWSHGTNNNEDWKFTLVPSSSGHIGTNGTLNGSTISIGGLAWIDDSPPHSNNIRLLSPMIDVSNLTAPMLSFFLISDNEGEVNVDFAVDVWDGSAWNTNLFTSNTNTVNESWQEIEIPLNNLTITGNIQIRFDVDDNNSSFDDDLAIDDVQVKEAPMCIAPTNLFVDNISATSADLSWTENNGASVWNIEWGTAGFV